MENSVYTVLQSCY